MSYEAKVIQYREHLAQLSYPEYAHNHLGNVSDHDNGDEMRLNLSLWNDELPPGVAEVTVRALPKAVGGYSFAQDATLIASLAKKLRVADSRVMITAGADDALRVASLYCIRPGTRTLIPVPCFGRYAYHAMIQEADIRYLRFDVYPYEFDVAKIINEVHEKKIGCLFIGSPNNPTGHALSARSIKYLLDAVSSSIILDESLLLPVFGESATELVEQYENLFICGSFSKLYGLSGLRIGYLVANPVHSKQLRKLVSPFGIDGLALEIAKHMMTQEDWLQDRISAILSSLTILRGTDLPQFRVTHTSAPVALVEYTGSRGNLYWTLRDHGVSTVPGDEFPGLKNTNAVRVIIKNVQDVLHLKKILVNIA